MIEDDRFSGEEEFLNQNNNTIIQANTGVPSSARRSTPVCGLRVAH